MVIGKAANAESAQRREKIEQILDDRAVALALDATVKAWALRRERDGVERRRGRTRHNREVLRLRRVRTAVHRMASVLEMAEALGLASSVKAHYYAAGYGDPSGYRGNPWLEWCGALLVLDETIGHRLGADGGGRPVGDVHSLALDLARLLHREGYKLGKTRDGGFARVLDLVLDGLGLEAPNDWMPILIASIDQVRRECAEMGPCAIGYQREQTSRRFRRK